MTPTHIGSDHTKNIRRLRFTFWSIAILCILALTIRFKPGDGIEVVAEALTVPRGVVLLVVAALALCGFWLTRKITRVSFMDAIARWLCLALGIVSAVLGAFSF